MATRRNIGLFAVAMLYLLLIEFSADARRDAQKGKIICKTVYSASLEKNLFGDSPHREVTIYLPPRYYINRCKRYPVVYLLHGYGGDNNLWLGKGYIEGNILDSMQQWLVSGKAVEMILVMPNSYNRFKGSMYTNSVATGGWADFIAKDLVKYIDEHYRTLPQRKSRAIVGHSMGGYGAVKIGMLYPEVFSCIGGLAGWYVVEAYARDCREIWAYTATLENWEQTETLDWRGLESLAWNASFAPNPDRPPFYGDSPFVYSDTQHGKVIRNDEIWDKFLKNDILRMSEEYHDALTDMEVVYLDSGTNDGCLWHTRMLHDKLKSFGVNLLYKEFIGDHLCCVMDSTGDALEVFSKYMANDMLDVKSIGSSATTWGQIKKNHELHE